jgi:hypothetical protein
VPRQQHNAAPAVPQGVIFHPASGLDATVAAQVQDCASEAPIWSATAPSRRPVANKPTWCSRRWNRSIAAPVPPPRAHRHRCYGALEPNAEAELDLSHAADESHVGSAMYSWEVWQ